MVSRTVSCRARIHPSYEDGKYSLGSTIAERVCASCLADRPRCCPTDLKRLYRHLEMKHQGFTTLADSHEDDISETYAFCFQRNAGVEALGKWCIRLAWPFIVLVKVITWELLFSRNQCKMDYLHRSMNKHELKHHILWSKGRARRLCMGTWEDPCVAHRHLGICRTPLERPTQSVLSRFYNNHR